MHFAPRGSAVKKNSVRTKHLNNEKNLLSNDVINLIASIDGSNKAVKIIIFIYSYIGIAKSELR